MSNADHRDRPRYVPASTYRLQVYREFPLTAARDVVPYLARLGVDTCYTSPYFTAEPGSTHGYDVCNHNEINPEVGGAEAHAAFTRGARRARHAAHRRLRAEPHGHRDRQQRLVERSARERARARPSAIFFDVDWRPSKPELQAKLLLPILGDQYGNVLERGELKLAFADGALVAASTATRSCPINPRQAPRVYSIGRGGARPARLGADNPHLHEFLSIIASLQNMPRLHRDRPGARGPAAS